MTDKITIPELKGTSTEQPQILGIPKETARFPFDNILKTDLPQPNVKKELQLDEQQLRFKQEKDERKKNGIPLKAKEVLITKPQQNDDDLRKELSRRAKEVLSDDVVASEKNEKRPVESQEVQTPERKMNNNNMVEQAELSESKLPVDADQSEQALAPPNQGEIDLTKSDRSGGGSLSSLSFVAAMNQVIHPDQKTPERDPLPNSTEPIQKKPVLRTSVQNVVAHTQLNTDPVKKVSTQLKAVSPTDVTSKLEVHPVAAKQSGPAQRANQTAMPAAQNNPSVTPKRTMLDLTRGARPNPSESRDKFEPKNIPAAAARNQGVVSIPGKDPSLVPAQPGLKTARVATAAIDGTRPESVRLHGKEHQTGEANWSRRSSNIPPRMTPSVPGKTPHIQPTGNPVKQPDDKPLNSRIGNSFTIEQDPAKSKVMLSAAAEREDLKPEFQQKGQAIRNTGENLNPGTVSKQKSLGVKTTGLRSENHVAMQSGKSAPELKIEAKRMEAVIPKGNPQPQVTPTGASDKAMAAAVDPAPGDMVKSNVIASAQTLPQMRSEKSPDKRRVRFFIPLTKKFSSLKRSSLDKARVEKNNTVSENMSRFSNIRSKGESIEMTEADTLKQQLRDRIEILKKAQDSQSGGADPSQASSLHRGLSAKIPGTPGFVPGDMRLLSPRTNPPLFARSFAQELIDKIQSAQMNQAMAKQIGKTTFVVNAGQLGSMDIEFQKESGKEQITVFVDNEMARHDLQKIMPQIEENLQQKGFNFTGLEVEIRNSDLKQQFDHSEDRAGSGSRRSTSDAQQEEVADEVNESDNRKYGYNTMEVLA